MNSPSMLRNSTALLAKASFTVELEDDSAFMALSTLRTPATIFADDAEVDRSRSRMRLPVCPVAPATTTVPDTASSAAAEAG